jgi:hypothetical protein
MSDNKNDGKGGQGPGTQTGAQGGAQPSGQTSGPTSGPKKPAPIIDLKATVVEVAKPATDSVKVEPAKTVAAAATDAAKAASATLSATSFPGPGAGAKPSDSKQPDPKAAAKPADTKPSAAPPVKPVMPAKSSGGFFTHMAAGLAGAILAIGGSQVLDLGLGGNANVSAELTKRLAALEQAAAKPASGGDAQKLAAAEARLAKLEDEAKALAGGQAKIAAEAKSVEERLLSQVSGGGDAATRVAKLEEQLTAMASAAAADPRGGTRLQQLAELTGKVREVETQLGTRTAQLRTEIIQQLDQRLAKSNEQTESARSLLAQRTQSVEQSVKSITEETTALRSGMDALKTNVDARLKEAAKPADVQAAIAPVATKLTQLETSMQGVVKSEQDRNATAGNILLSLELGNLKRALDRGGKYAAELAAVNKLAGGKLDLAVLEKQQNDGVPGLEALGKELAGIAHGMLDAEAEPADASIGDRMLSGIKSVVRVRKVDIAPGDKSTEAQIARMEAGLKEGRVADVIEIAKILSPKALTPSATKWLARIEQRAQIDKALSDLDASLKTSLAGGAQPKKGTN